MSEAPTPGSRPLYIELDASSSPFEGQFGSGCFGREYIRLVVRAAGRLNHRGTAAVVVAIAAFFAACAGPPELASPVGLMPDLRGTWKGTWGGAPLTLIILEQRDGEPADGVTVGPWQVFGRNFP